MFQEVGDGPDSEGGDHGAGEQRAAQVSLLLVDDHRPSMRALELVLEPLGYRLVTADSAAAALRLLASEHFTAILSDVRMPGMDGFEMLARLRKHGLAEQTAVILFSAVSNDLESARRAFDLGAVDFIAKPYDPDLLRSRIKALVRLCRQREPVAADSHAPAETVAAGRAATAVAVVEEAERLLRSKDKFVAVLGHDLRAPLSAMLASCQSLRGGSNLTERQLATVARLGLAVDRMSKMVADIVDFSRTASGTSFPIRPRPTNLGDLLSMVVDDVRGAHPDRPIDLSIADQLVVACDPDRIAQAVGNLIVNAVEHGQGAVRISAESRGNQVIVVVHNDGQPIPAHSIRTLFDPFVRKAERSAGLGLGLHIVNEIVRAHAGTVQVHSSAVNGTSFELCWPRWVTGRSLTA
jgi:signal transduction histidine kinase